MGKASRRKKERRIYAQPPMHEDRSSFRWVPQPEMSKDTKSHFTGTTIYRSFDSEEYADNFVAGNIWLSTLERCRQYEDPLQGDSGEATHLYSSGLINGGSNDAKFVRAAGNMGVKIEPGCSNITFNNCVSIQKLHDAFVICTSEIFDPKLSETFGNYCVEISDPKKFFAAISEALRHQPHIDFAWAGWGKIKYRDRTYGGLEDSPGSLGLVKPIKYAHQKEIRFMWGVKDDKPIAPFSLFVPELKNLCRRIA